MSHHAYGHPETRKGSPTVESTAQPGAQSPEIRDDTVTGLHTGIYGQCGTRSGAKGVGVLPFRPDLLESPSIQRRSRVGRYRHVSLGRVVSFSVSDSTVRHQTSWKIFWCSEPFDSKIHQVLRPDHSVHTLVISMCPETRVFPGCEPFIPRRQ